MGIFKTLKEHSEAIRLLKSEFGLLDSRHRSFREEVLNKQAAEEKDYYIDYKGGDQSDSIPGCMHTTAFENGKMALCVFNEKRETVGFYNDVIRFTVKKK